MLSDAGIAPVKRLLLRRSVSKLLPLKHMSSRIPPMLFPHKIKSERCGSILTFGGMDPLSLLRLKSIVLRFLQFPMFEGTVPDKRFPASNNFCREEKGVAEEKSPKGIFPVKALELRLRT